jgi:chitin synthase
MITKTNPRVCQILNYTMYSIMILIAVVLAVQCLCSLIYLFRRKRTILRDDTRSKIIVMVPCYNEGDKELRKTIDSVMDSSYPDDNKVLLVVADGNITGKGEKKSTPETLSKILGYTMSSGDRTYKCKSIGDLTENRAKLYCGTMRDCGKELKYIVIVKTGTAAEKGSPRAGNRGKRDSQLLFTGLLNRFHHGRKLNDLDVAMKNALDSMQVPLDEVRYLMAIDADTRIERDSISHMAYSMNKNDHILALCGETKVENKSQSWVTMIQVFEYYTNHHMKKAFESVFGCVTCLPGCFTMYRLYSDDGRPLLSCDDVYQRYATNNVKTLHDKNLYHLGEDRMLTTLLLRYFPDMRLSFVPEAHCYTIVPHTFKILLSQRRRWINSTFHNMLELVRVNTMCGVCCFSMKTIVVLDLIATLILPASLIYVGYIVYITFWMGEPLSLLMLVVWGIVVGVQVIVFLLRSRWDYWWWFFVFIFLGVPVFYFVLPIYSFWHMDDFSWGATRQVDGKASMVSKSRDETECESPGFEVTADDYHQQTNPRAAARQSQVKKPRPSGPVDVDEDMRKYSTIANQNHHSYPIDTDDITMDDFSHEMVLNKKQTDYDPNKYRSAEEAKQARRMRRGEC